MKEKQDILDRIGRRSGMTVPEHYFADFSAEMMSRLPEKPVESTGKVLPRSVWQRVCPYIYLAAMFSGVWLMMWLFNDISGRVGNPSMEDNPILAEGFSNDQFFDSYISNEVDQYDLLEDMYNDGVTLTSFQQL